MGKFQKGNPGGPGGRREPPGGRPPMETVEVRKIIEAWTVEVKGQPPQHASLLAFGTLIAEMQSASPNKDRITAARLVMDRQLGKPKESITVESRNSGDVLMLCKLAVPKSDAEAVNALLKGNR
ncbi:MAG: hypothetical protein LW650_15525 [Planctomycetaceae bacterium]|jgi:hypothetical protein|nr:hypothetical protein [Planctomycetaceae bacterium]